MPALEDFSDEILEKIFSFLPGDSIPILTTVSNRFNEVISSSVTLMNNFDIQWSKNKDLDMRPLLNSTRKYRKLQVYEVSGLKHNLHQFIADHCKTLTSLYFYECTFATSEIQSILELVSENLEVFSVCEMNLEADVDIQPISFPKLKDIDLMYGRFNGFVSILKAFEGSQASRFQYEDDFEMNSQEMKVFKSFLLSQKKLRHLSLTCNVTKHLFTTSEFARSVQFQATQIFIWMKLTLGADHFSNLSVFLETQRDSVEVLTLGRCKLQRPIMDTVLSLRALKDIRFVQNVFRWEGELNIKNTSLERMFVSLQDTTVDGTFCQVMQSFPKVKELKFSCINLTFGMSMVMAYDMKHLTKSEFFNCKFSPITFPRMKQTTFSSCDIDDVMRQILVNRHMKEVVVPFHYSQEDRFLAAVLKAHIRSVVFDQAV